MGGNNGHNLNFRRIPAEFERHWMNFWFVATVLLFADRVCSGCHCIHTGLELTRVLTLVPCNALLVAHVLSHDTAVGATAVNCPGSFSCRTSSGGSRDLKSPLSLADRPYRTRQNAPVESLNIF